ncbi:unnamed protein product [Rhizophagus irregularis]|nr:unnamed protein product [Rhizophagus irregularis]
MIVYVINKFQRKKKLDDNKSAINVISNEDKRDLASRPSFPFKILASVRTVYSFHYSRGLSSPCLGLFFIRSSLSDLWVYGWDG